MVNDEMVVTMLYGRTEHEANEETVKFMQAFKDSENDVLSYIADEETQWLHCYMNGIYIISIGFIRPGKINGFCREISYQLF